MQLHRRLDRGLEAARMAQHPLDVLDHLTGAHQQRIGDLGEAGAMPVPGLSRHAAAQVQALGTPFLERVELLFAQLLELADFAASLQQCVPVVKRAPRIEQQTLPAFELIGQVADADPGSDRPCC
jgi:hypothetical protein